MTQLLWFLNFIAKIQPRLCWQLNVFEGEVLLVVMGTTGQEFMQFENTTVGSGLGEEDELSIRGRECIRGIAQPAAR